MNDEPPFQRTVCDCDRCVGCCSHPAYLIPRDVYRIIDYLVKEDRIVDADTARRLFRASDRTKVGTYVNGRLMIRSVPTITPQVKYGACVFLKNNRCSIHAVAPFGCAYHDMHMPYAEADMRSKWAIREIIASEAYAEFRSTLST